MMKDKSIYKDDLLKNFSDMFQQEWQKEQVRKKREIAQEKKRKKLIYKVS